MKTILRFWGLAAILSVVLGFAATDAIGQNACDDAEGIAALHVKIDANYKRNETASIAVQASKEFLQKYGQCESTEKLTAWIKAELPGLEKSAAAYEEYVWRQPRLDKFENGLRNGKFDDVFAAGEELAGRYPDNVSYPQRLGLIGLAESYKSNFKYNELSIKYAKIALAKFQGGAVQFQGNREEAVSELNYALGYMLYYGNKDKKAGLLYYYEVSQNPGAFRNEPRLYATMGQYYIDEAGPIGTAIAELIRAQEEAKTEAEKEKLDAEIRPKIALYKGYLERSLDALSRAYRVVDDKIASEKTLKGQVYKALQFAYSRREPAIPLDKWIADAGTRALANPATDVTPVYDPEPSPTAKPADAVPAGTKTPAVKPGTVKPRAGAVKKPLS